MHYEYVDCFEKFTDPPTPAERASASHILFSANDISQWYVNDFADETAWKDIPVHRIRKETSVRISGRFEDILTIDRLPRGTLSYWVPISTLNWKDPRLPVNLTKFPMVEITYQCLTEHVYPIFICIYPDGEQQITLPTTPGKRTVASLVARNTFPAQLDGIIFRFYCDSRTTATVEIDEIRFRALLPKEIEKIQEAHVYLDQISPPQECSILEDFLPIGVHIDGSAARRLAEMLGLSLQDYWWLAFEDITRHHHNTIAIANFGQLTPSEQAEFLTLAEKYGVRIVFVEGYDCHWNSDDDKEELKLQAQKLTYSKTLLAWQLYAETPLQHLTERIELRQYLEQYDPRHPLVAVAPDSSKLPVLAKHFPVVALQYRYSHTPWKLGKTIASHISLTPTQHFWIYAPAHVGPSGIPKWSSCPEMRIMVNLSFATGARGWFSQSYHNDPAWAGGIWERSLTGPFLAFSDLWAELDIDMNLYNAIAPLLLHASPQEIPTEWQNVFKTRRGENTLLPEELPPISSFRLKGVDYDVYFFVSNDMRGMTPLDFDIPESLVNNLEVHDLGDFVRSRKWTQMPLQRHIEMFPGQARVIFVAASPVCAWWRNLIAARLIEDDRRQIQLNMDLARAYGFDTRPVEELLSSTEGDDVLRLQYADRATAMLTDLLYSLPDAVEARSAVIEGMALLCACDGALCRLLRRGKIGPAQDLGRQVISIARELTKLRIDLRKGERERPGRQARELVERASKLLSEIRGMIEPPSSRMPFHHRY